MRSKEDSASTISGQSAKRYPVFALLIVVFFVTMASGCATVESTVDKVKSGVSDRFNKDDAPDSESEISQVKEPVSDPEPPKPTKKPILIDIQEKLRTMGYYSGPISGKLDSRTEAAIQDFQLDNDLRINGRPTESLLQEINKAIKLL